MWIVRNSPRILTGERGELRLQVDIPAGQAAGQASGKPRAHAGFVVVLGLAGRVDAPKTLADRERDEALGVGPLPGPSP